MVVCGRHLHTVCRTCAVGCLVDTGSCPVCGTEALAIPVDNRPLGDAIAAFLAAQEHHFNKTIE